MNPDQQRYRSLTTEAWERLTQRAEAAEQEVKRLEAELICGPFGKTWQEACEEAEAEVKRLREQIQRERIERTTAHGGVVSKADHEAKLNKAVALTRDRLEASEREVKRLWRELDRTNDLLRATQTQPRP